MSQIRAKDTKPEILVRRFLHSRGFRYRLHKKDLPGKPDIVLPKYKTVIFVHGCYWHGHESCAYRVIPKTNTQWWVKKLGANKDRDKKVFDLLQRAGWKVIIVWECELKPKPLIKTFANLPGKITDPKT